MQPTESGRTNPDTRRTWEPPAATRLAIGAETKSAGVNAQRRLAETSGAGQARFAEPRPAAPPKTKFGFYFEMAFPLSARWGS
jgi:hypothetical protein